VSTIQANGIQIAYSLTGSGQPILLISGVGYDAWFWHKIVPALSEHYQVITFDNRGSGESAKPHGPYTVSMLAADTAGLLDSINLKNAIVLGHSLGGFIAQELAITRRDLVSHLILASTNHGGPDVIPITPEALQILTDRNGNPTELVKRGIAIATAPGFAERQPEVMQELLTYRFTNPVPPAQYTAQVMAGAGMAAFTSEDIATRMAAITMPTLILFGEHDRVVPPGNATLLAEKLPNAQIAILPEAGHIFPIEQPEATVNTIFKFLR
jgi:pimeloyl-ACP methyl ester carboxylesterase